ncbi:MAG: substrate-binding domain-containing protein [Lachnospiraceae bacterium]|nr:substrate-binding domain-containing protein [Lachnospiraceae bacterium]
MKIKKYLTAFLAICVLSVQLLTGCGNEEEPVREDTAAAEEPIQIGMSFDSFVIERWQKDRDVFVAEAKTRGAEVNVQNANGDLAEQISQIQYLIGKKVDVIVIVAIDCEGLSDVVRQAKDAGIKVIAYDRLISHADVDLYISFDNEKVGTLMGEALAGCELPNKKVLMLAGPVEDSNVSMIETGFRREMDKNNIEIVDVMHADGWKAELASAYINDNIERLDEIDAIMCGNDMIATNVIRTLAENRLAGKIKIVGQDADLEACQRIVEGTQVMTVYKPVENLARKAAQYACLMAEGKPFLEKEEGEENVTISDGTYDVPYVVLDPISVDAHNMQEVIIDTGFHFEEDVYLNVRK